jgi:anti-sigma regulatory factor (Ser/Thr protein kinase)
MCVVAHVVLPAEPDSVRRARQHVAALLEADDTGVSAEVACLLVSELVTNAVLHAGSEVEIRVTSGPTAVRVEVVDGSSRPAVRRHFSAESSTGRGMLLVEALASGWGVEPRATGKAVWFELARGRARSPGDSRLRFA